MKGTLSLYTNHTCTKIIREVSFNDVPRINEHFRYEFDIQLFGFIRLHVNAKTRFPVIEVIEPTIFSIDIPVLLIFKTNAQVYKLEFMPLQKEK